MESLEKAYSGRKRTKIFWIVIMVVILGIFYFQPEILESMNIKPRIHPGFSFILGGFFVQSLYYFFVSLSRPKTRICNHFLIDNYDQNVFSWSKIEKVKIEGDYLIFIIPKGRLWKEYRISLFSTVDKDVEKICEIRGIPFEKQENASNP